MVIRSGNHLAIKLDNYPVTKPTATTGNSIWGHFGFILGLLWIYVGVALGLLWDNFGFTLGSYGSLGVRGDNEGP